MTKEKEKGGEYMGKIQELSEQLANQIAAGEVVERPSSVVKELVENAIDAGSTQIDIEIEEAGLKKIQVTDNGEGIQSEDVLSAFKRHATSKIHSRDDLFRIRTLGFRGEALPSIASVSKTTIETSTGNEGSYVKLLGGKVVEHKPHSLRKGTKIIVEDLFYNTPARLKYVKSVQTELANIGDILNRMAMSHPDIAFRLTHDGHKMMATLGNGELKQAIAGIYGVSTAKKMLAFSAKDLDFQVNGYVSLPELTRASRNYISLIINGRYIKNYTLNKAIIEGYGSKLMVGRFPISVVSIQMDPLLVDVNVHPTKQEVRLSKEKELKDLITSGIAEILSEQQLIPNAADNLGFKRKQELTQKAEQIQMPLDHDKGDKTVSSTYPTYKNMQQQGLAYDAKEGRFYVPQASEEKASSILSENRASLDKKVMDPYDMSDWIPKSAYDELEQAEVLNNKQVVQEENELLYQSSSSPQFGSEEENLIEEKVEILESEVPSQEHPEMDAAQINRLADKLTQEPAPSKKFPELEYFGQMHGTYLFAQSSDGLYIIDQHAAQERIKYELFRKQIGEVSNDLQELLVPIILDYPNSDALRIKENTEVLQEVGIYLESFGQNSFIVRAHPTWYPKGEEEQTVREMIEMFLETGKVSVAKFREATAIMMSCKQSIKANHHLDERQARVLLDDLAKCENPFNCPHGRPVLIHFTNIDMEKMFKRIQDPH